MADFETFWQTYPSDLCNRKGSRKQAEQVWSKIDKSEYNQIIINMRELMRVDRKVKKTGASKSDWIWPMVTTWLRGERWADIEDIKQSDDMPVDKRLCECGEPVAVKDKCDSCFYGERDKQHDKELYAHLISIGYKKEEGETQAEYNKKCREYHKTSHLDSLYVSR